MGSFGIIVGYILIGSVIGHNLYKMIKKSKGVC